MVGRDFLKEHILWQIMDGEDVSIWEDKWIFGVGSKKIGHPSLMENQLPKKVFKIMGKSNGE